MQERSASLLCELSDLDLVRFHRNQCGDAGHAPSSHTLQYVRPNVSSIIMIAASNRACALAALLLASLSLLGLSHIRDSHTSQRTVTPRNLSPETSVGSRDTGLPVYPKGDCVTQCSMDPAFRMAHCPSDPSAGIPATTCEAVEAGSEASDDSCPSFRFPDAL